MNKRGIVLAFLLMLSVTGFLFGQADRGTITGLVTDPSGAAMAGVQVVVTNVETGVRNEATTNDAGAYTLPNIPIGLYKVEFEKAGFKKFERAGLTVTVAQKLRLDVAMEVGDVKELVTVTAEAPLLNTENTIVGNTLQSKVITDLPLSFSGGRAVENFAYAVTPSVEGNNWTSYIAGGAAFSKEVLIDGVSATAQISGHIGESSPAMESVQEFKVQTSGMSAEYGHSSGGMFNFTLKSGTNDFHGSAFYYGHNEALNANTWMNNWQGSQCNGDPACEDKYKRAVDRQNLYGFSAGGPVWIPKVYNGKNKTFVFGALENYKQQRLQLGSYTQTVPIPEFLNGDFSKLLTSEVVGTDALGRSVYAGQIYDPATLRQVNGKWVSDPFVGNIIPSNRFSAVSKKVTDIYSKQYQPMVPGRLTQNSALTLYNDPWFHQNQLTFKADHNVTDNFKFSGSFIWTERPRYLVDQGGVWDPSDPNNSGGPFAKSRLQDVTSRSARLSNNWLIRPNLINTFSFAYNRYNNPSNALAPNEGNWPEYLGLGSSTSASHFPEINFGGAVNGISETNIGYNSAGFYVTNTYIFNEGLTWIKGRHTMKMGGEVWAHQQNSHNGIDTLGFNFSNSTTGLPGASYANRVGFGFASFLLGAVDGGSKNVPFDLYGRRKYVDVYYTDDIKVSSKLTLSLGLRWEQSQPWSERYGRWANFNPNIMNTALGVKGALEFATPGSTFEGPRYWKEFAPRIGASYQLTNRVLLRGGWGVFYTPQGVNYWSGVPYGFAPGYRGTDIVTSSGNKPQFNWDNGYPSNYIPPTQDPNFLTWGMVGVDPRTLQDGYTHQYNFNAEFHLARNTMVEAAFLGNQGRRLHGGFFNKNQPTRAAYEDPKVNPYAWIWDDASAASAGVILPYSGFSYYAGGALQPFPQVATTWGPLFTVGSPLGSSDYKSFQVSLTQRPTKGLTAQVSYNLSRANSMTDTNFDETWWIGPIQDQYNLESEKGIPIGYDQTHIFKGYVGYELPFGHGQKFLANAHPVVDAILGGWNVTTIFKYNTGQPMGVSPDVWYPGWEGAVYANWDSSVNLNSTFNSATFNPGNQADSGNNYFNTAAFSNPTDHKLGNGKRFYSELRSPGWSNEDIGFFKYWRYKERLNFQLRMEFINAFNRHHYDWPGTSIANKNTFGKITSVSGDARVVQFGLRLGW
jgi:hypothetical protein